MSELLFVNISNRFSLTVLAVELSSGELVTTGKTSPQPSVKTLIKGFCVSFGLSILFSLPSASGARFGEEHKALLKDSTVRKKIAR